MELSLSSALQATSVPASLLQALRALDQELGEDTEREALEGVVDSLVEWFLGESRTPRTGDGALLCCVRRGVVGIRNASLGRRLTFFGQIHRSRQGAGCGKAARVFGRWLCQSM